MSKLRRVEIKVLPKQISIYLTYFEVMRINAGLNKNGIGQVYSPRKLVTENAVEYDLHCKANFSQCVHNHSNPDKTNRMQNRIFPGIYLGATGNM